MERETIELSVIVPISERHDDIEELYNEYVEIIGGMGVSFEIIFVIDGAFPAAYRELKSLKDESAKITIIKLARSFGEATAISEGFRHASGEKILTLPAYHQVDLSKLPDIRTILEDCDVVAFKRWPRVDSRLNQAQTVIFRSLVKYMTGVTINDIGCGVRLMRRKVLQEVSIYGDLHRFIPILAHKQGFRVKEIDISQSSREKRLRAYGAGVYVRRMIDLLTVFFLTKFTKKPLRFFGLTGTAVMIPGVMLILYLGIGRVFFDIGLSNRPLFLLGILLLVLGIQIFAIGLVGEIIIFTHAKDVKEYTVEEIID